MSKPEIMLLPEFCEKSGIKDKQNAAKWVKRHGFEIIFVRGAITNNKRVRALRLEDAEKALQLRKDMGYAVPDKAADWEIVD